MSRAGQRRWDNAPCTLSWRSPQAGTEGTRGTSMLRRTTREPMAHCHCRGPNKEYAGRLTALRDVLNPKIPSPMGITGSNLERAAAPYPHHGDLRSESTSSPEYCIPHTRNMHHVHPWRRGHVSQPSLSSRAPGRLLPRHVVGEDAWVAPYRRDSEPPTPRTVEKISKAARVAKSKYVRRVLFLILSIFSKDLIISSSEDEILLILILSLNSIR